MNDLIAKTIEESSGLPDFVHLLKTQENLCTARPLIFELQVREVDFCPDGYGDESAPAKDCPHLTEAPEDLGLDPEQMLHWKYRWEGRAWFLTKNGYEEHLELNRHNYPKEIRYFIKHAFRSPEMVRVYQWLEQGARFREALEIAVKALQEHVFYGSRYDEIALEKIQAILCPEGGG
jgi:hypothetical protein